MIPDWNQLPILLEAFSASLGCLLAGIILHFLPWKWKEHLFILCGKMPVWLLGISCIAGMMLLYQFSSGDSQPFIYFQF
jgi:hypothetical protein